MDAEQHVPKAIGKGKAIIKDDSYMKFYNEKEPLYLETNASGVGLGEGILWVTDGIQFPKDVTPDNTALCPVAFLSKILTSADTRYSNTEMEALWIFMTLKSSNTITLPIKSV